MFHFYDDAMTMEEMYLDQLIDQMHTFAELGREKDAKDVYSEYKTACLLGQ